MFKKISSTSFSPDTPMLLWDSDCSFCKFWKTRWERYTGDLVHFEPYQQSAHLFKDIPLKEFKKASRLIDTDGSVYSGPDSAYRSLYIGHTKIWHIMYKKYDWFEWLSDHAYNHIAKHRALYYKFTIIMLGKNPKKLKHYWIVYLALLIIIFVILF